MYLTSLLCVSVYFHQKVELNWSLKRHKYPDIRFVDQWYLNYYVLPIFIRYMLCRFLAIIFQYFQSTNISYCGISFRWDNYVLWNIYIFLLTFLHPYLTVLDEKIKHKMYYNKQDDSPFSKLSSISKFRLADSLSASDNAFIWASNPSCICWNCATRLLALPSTESSLSFSVWPPTNASKQQAKDTTAKRAILKYAGPPLLLVNLKNWNTKLALRYLWMRVQTQDERVQTRTIKWVIVKTLKC